MTDSPLVPRPALILAIDTCGATGTLILARIEENATIVVAQAELVSRTFASLLVSRISELFNHADAQLDQLSAVAVVHGPGSFTGVRIGVAAAKALAEARGKPLIAISRLAVLCRLAGQKGLYCGVLDAGRGEFYAGIYHMNGSEQCIREKVMNREAILAAATGAILVAAEPSVADWFPNSALIRVPMPSAIDALPIAVARLRLQRYDDPSTLDGNYLRRTDAELLARPGSHSGSAITPRR